MLRSLNRFSDVYIALNQANRGFLGKAVYTLAVSVELAIAKLGFLGSWLVFSSNF